MKSDFTYAASGAAISHRHIASLETEGEREVRVRGASERIAHAYSIPNRQARLLVKYSSVRVRA